MGIQKAWERAFRRIISECLRQRETSKLQFIDPWAYRFQNIALSYRQRRTPSIGSKYINFVKEKKDTTWKQACRRMMNRHIRLTTTDTERKWMEWAMNKASSIRKKRHALITKG